MPRILVVEDSPTMLYIITKTLQEHGYDVVQAKDGDEAFQLAVAEKPHVILLDVILPKLNGYQVCRQIKSTRDTEAIPVVMLTSKTRNQDRQWGIEQGADDYIMKPVEAAALLEVVQQYAPLTET